MEEAYIFLTVEDATYQELAEDIFQLSRDFSDGLAYTTYGGIKRFVDERGQVQLTLGAEWLEVGDFHDGLVKVRKADGWYMMDKKGQIVSEAMGELAEKC
ncbi:MAG: hypothetical protein IJ315_01345 [Firmicutes bacterium]|nr:hypothetical protein [Bacillota bacterium]